MTKHSSKARLSVAVAGLRDLIARARGCNSGATMVEYAILIALISLVIASGVASIGSSVTRMLLPVEVASR